MCPTRSVDLSFIFFNNDGLQALGGGNHNWLHVREQWVLGVLLLVSLSGDFQSQSEWNTLDTSLPDLLVQSWVQTHLLSAHVQLGELLDLLDGSWSSLLERDTMQLRWVSKAVIEDCGSCYKRKRAALRREHQILAYLRSHALRS